MHVKLNKNIGSEDLRKFGLLPGGDPVALRKALDTYAKDKIVDVPDDGEFHDYLIKRGLAVATDEPLSPPPDVKGVAKTAAITAPAKPDTFKENPHDPALKKDK